MQKLEFGIYSSSYLGFKKCVECFVELIVPHGTPARSEISYREIPQIVDVVDWCIDMFGDDNINKSWVKRIDIGTDNYSRMSNSGPIKIRKTLVRFYFENDRDVALFKLRWG